MVGYRFVLNIPYFNVPTLNSQDAMTAFKAEAASTGKPRLLLAAAVGAGKATIDAAYEIPSVCS